MTMLFLQIIHQLYGYQKQRSSSENMKKNSDSDYKAEDQGSATEGLSKKKPLKKNPIHKLNKKEVIQQAINNFLPEGVTLTKDDQLTQQKYNELKNLDEAPQFTLNFKIFLAKVVKVVDGDTIKAAIWLNNNFFRFTFRLNGIDTPQTRKGQVKQFGKKVKDIIINMLQKKMVRIEAGQFDKYGRILARVYAYEQISQNEHRQFCVNDFLIENDLARSYHGKTKVQFSAEDYQMFQDKYEFKEWPVVVNYPYK